MSQWRSLLIPKWVIASVLVLVGTAVCVRLGIWQLDRLTLRRAFNAHYLETSTLPPLLLTAEPKEDLNEMEYRPVNVVGKFDFSQNIVRRNQYHESQTGYSLLTPLVLSDGTAILVERGWIPAEGNQHPVDWHKYDEFGLVRIPGILRLGQTKAEVGGIADPPLASGQDRLDFWYQVNLERISQQVPYKLLLVFIQPDVDPVKTSPPYPYQPEIEITEGPHLGYAAQWFTFAAILFFGYPFFLRRQLIQGNTSTEIEEN